MNVFLIAAISADGFIAENKTQTSTQWTSQADKQFFIEKTKEAGVVIMGSTTFATIGRPLPNRLNVIYTRNPEKIPTHPNIRTTQLPPKELIEELEKEGYTSVAVCGGSNIYTQFLASGLVNKLYLTIEPILFGSGIKLFDKDVLVRLQLVKTTKLTDQTVVLEYNVQ